MLSLMKGRVGELAIIYGEVDSGSSRLGPGWSTMPGSGMCMLRRLFPLLATMTSYSRERRPTRKEGNCDYQLRGKRSGLKLQKPV